MIRSLALIWFLFSVLDLSECKLAVLGKGYVGQKAETRSGKECQRWDRQTPHSHTRNVDSTFPEGDTTLANNYCRSVYLLFYLFKV